MAQYGLYGAIVRHSLSLPEMLIRQQQHEEGQGTSKSCEPETTKSAASETKQSSDVEANKSTEHLGDLTSSNGDKQQTNEPDQDNDGSRPGWLIGMALKSFEISGRSRGAGSEPTNNPGSSGDKIAQEQSEEESAKTKQQRKLSSIFMSVKRILDCNQPAGGNDEQTDDSGEMQPTNNNNDTQVTNFMNQKRQNNRLAFKRNASSANLMNNCKQQHPQKQKKRLTKAAAQRLAEIRQQQLEEAGGSHCSYNGSGQSNGNHLVVGCTGSVGPMNSQTPMGAPSVGVDHSRLSAANPHHLFQQHPGQQAQFNASNSSNGLSQQFDSVVGPYLAAALGQMQGNRNSPTNQTAAIQQLWCNANLYAGRQQSDEQQRNLFAQMQIPPRAPAPTLPPPPGAASQLPPGSFHHLFPSHRPQQQQQQQQQSDQSPPPPPYQQDAQQQLLIAAATAAAAASLGQQSGGPPGGAGGAQPGSGLWLNEWMQRYMLSQSLMAQQRQQQQQESNRISARQQNNPYLDEMNSIQLANQQRHQVAQQQQQQLASNPINLPQEQQTRFACSMTNMQQQRGTTNNFKNVANLIDFNDDEMDIDVGRPFECSLGQSNELGATSESDFEQEEREHEDVDEKLIEHNMKRLTTTTTTTTTNVDHEQQLKVKEAPEVTSVQVNQID